MVERETIMGVGEGPVPFFVKLILAWSKPYFFPDYTYICPKD